ncbi:MAG: LytTR family DNA-binding domain-containing protein [Mediterraneibacter faecis]
MFETSENNHKIILHAKKRVVEFTGHLKSVEVQLDYRFYRCHRSYIVNTDNIKEVNFSKTNNLYGKWRNLSNLCPCQN